MNILLFGKTGQVGWELQRALAPLGNVIALDVKSEEYCGDFSNPEGIAETVRVIKPDVIVNAAAHTAVDKAESEQEFAQLLNATSVEAIAKEAAKIGAWVVHYSTDYVFPGDGETHGAKRMRPHLLMCMDRPSSTVKKRSRHIALNT